VNGMQANETVLKQRRQLLALSLDARIAAAGGGPQQAPTSPGAPTVLENTAHREGTALDALFNEYEALQSTFAAFGETETAKRFFRAVEPAYRTAAALTSTQANDFAETEADRYAERWQAYYGPQLRSAQTIVVRNGWGPSLNTRTVVTSSSAGSFNARERSAETAALQCEQREANVYRARNQRVADPNAQVAATKEIQDRCRAEQGLAAY
jgi:hypothetical protein